MPVISIFKRLNHEFEASLGCTLSSRPAWTTEEASVSEKNYNKNKKAKCQLKLQQGEKEDGVSVRHCVLSDLMAGKSVQPKLFRDLLSRTGIRFPCLQLSRRRTKWL